MYNLNSFNAYFEEDSILCVKEHIRLIYSEDVNVFCIHT